MNWTDAVVADDRRVQIPPNWLFLHYYEALTILFRVENTLRTFVYVILKDRYKDEWSALTLASEDGGQTTLAAVARKRMTQDASFGYLGHPIASPLMHLTSGELIRLMLADSYWPLFAPFFPATKHIVQTKLEEIGNVRNALAHFRPLKNDDVQVVRQNANQVLTRVEDALSKLVGIANVVPTNTTDAWYAALKTLSAPNMKIEFQQSDDDRWVQIALRYTCPQLGTPDVSKTYRYYRVLTILTPPIVKSSAAILKHVIFASEYVPYLSSTGDAHPEIYKTIELYFSRATLAAEYATIKPELESVLNKISAETALMHEDNLARGEFVRSSWAYGSRATETAEWKYSNEALKSAVSDNDPTEYWAGKPLFGEHFLTNTESFPWMPVNISRFTPPF